MSAAILPDGSIVFRARLRTVHVDVPTRTIVVRDGRARDEMSGEMLASFPLAAAEKIRVIAGGGGVHKMFLDLHTGQVLELGQSPNQDMAMLTAWALADVSRCEIWLEHGETKERIAEAPRWNEDPPPYDEVAYEEHDLPEEATDEPTLRLLYPAPEPPTEHPEAPQPPKRLQLVRPEEPNEQDTVPDLGVRLKKKKPPTQPKG